MIKKHLFSFILLIGFAQASTEIISWDEPVLGTGLHVTYQGVTSKGKGWSVRETRSDDVEFYKTLLGNPVVVKTMGTGVPLPLDGVPGRVSRWVAKFSLGNPTGRMVVVQEEKPIGFAHLVSCLEPGRGEIFRALVPEAQGDGLGKAMLGFLVTELAPRIRKQGLGIGIDPSHPTVEKFKCFEGEALNLIYTTAKPSNPASWQCYKHFDFKPSPPTDLTHQISCETWEESQHGPLEGYIVQKYFEQTSADHLKMNVRYGMLDENGILRTLSFVEQYGSLRYHFERQVD